MKKLVLLWLCAAFVSAWTVQATTIGTDENACAAPTALSAIPYPTSATLSWDGNGDNYPIQYTELANLAESANAQSLQYDNDTLHSVLGSDIFWTWIWGSMYPASMLGDHDGYLYKVAVYEVELFEDDYEVRIYSGGDNAPDSLIYTMTITPIGKRGFHESFLGEPVAIDHTKNLWIVLSVPGTFVSSCCQVSEPNPNNQWIYDDDNDRWVNINSLYESPYLGWMIRGYIDDVNPFATATWTTTNAATPSATVSGLSPETAYALRVKSDCGNNEQSNWAITTFTTPALCDAPNTLLISDTTHNSASLSWLGYQDNYTVRYRTSAYIDYSNFHESDFTQVGADETTIAMQDTFSFDLSAYGGVGNVAIRHYHCSDLHYLNVDDIVLTDANQNPIFTEDFESIQLSDRFVLIDNDGDGFNWILQNAYMDSQGNEVGHGTHCVGSASYYLPDKRVLYPDNWMIIPNVELGGTLSVVARSQDPHYFGEIFGVYVSNTQIAVPAGEWLEVTTTETSLPLSGLEASKRYDVQIQGVCQSGLTDWSELLEFRTLAANQETNLDIISSPNPGGTKFFRNGHIYIFRDGAIYDAMGNKVRTPEQ